MLTKLESYEPRAFSITNRLHEFHPNSDNWEIFFDTYIQADGVTDDSHKRNLLITSPAVEPFKTVLSICERKKTKEQEEHVNRRHKEI